MPTSHSDRIASGALRVHLTVPPEARHTTQHFPVEVVFSNSNDTAIRLLDRFEPVPVFFSFTLYRPDETPIALPGGGKIDFMAGSLQYLEVPPDDSLTVTLDLAPLFPSDLELPPGLYRLEAVYHNQYGDGCFRGRLQSPPTTLSIRT